MTERMTAGRTVGLGPEHEEETVDSLRQERDFWKSLFEGLVAEFPESAFVVDDDGRITHWNEKQEAFMGRTEQEVLGEQAYDVAGSDDEDETLAEEVARTGEPVREDKIRSGTNADGEEWHVRVLAVPLRNAAGEVVGSMEVVSQVTALIEQRKQLERLGEQVQTDIEASVTNLDETAQQVTDNAREIADIAETESENLQGVNEEIQTFSATTEEVASSVDTITDTSQEAETIARESETETERLLSRVSEVSETSQRLGEKANSLDERMSEIDGIIEVIDDITNQINILALNASIEAARADEAGEGFAVVADEIKSLATQSQEEADKIESLVAAVGENTTETVESVERTIEAIEEVTRQIETVNENQQRIQETIADVASQLDQIATATDEQATTAEEMSSIVKETVDAVDRVSEEVSELAGANERQARQISEIRESIRGLGHEMESIGAD